MSIHMCVDSGLRTNTKHAEVSGLISGLGDRDPDQQKFHGMKIDKSFFIPATLVITFLGRMQKSQLLHSRWSVGNDGEPLLIKSWKR